MSDDVWAYPTEPVDETGRRYNPEMFAPRPDPTAREWPATGDGDPMTVEERTWMARMALHQIEALLIYLTPRVRVVVAYGILSVMDLAVAEEAGFAPDEIDPGREIRDYMDGPSGAAVMDALKQLDLALRICHSCGRVHGTDYHDSLLHGKVGWVENATGLSVRLLGADEHEVRILHYPDSSAETEETLDRADFEARYVPGDNVPVLGEDGIR